MIQSRIKSLMPAVQRKLSLFDDEDFVPVTVVIPCFRCAGTIRRAVRSVWRQTRKPCQVILVDDASGDDTLSVLNSLSKNYPNWIKVISHDVNKGSATARNSGWDSATTPYIAFLDSDDSWHFEKIAVQYEFMRCRPTIALTGHPFAVLRPNETMPINNFANCKAKKIGPIRLCIKNRFSTPTVMLTRNLPFRFNDGKRYSEDYHLWLQIVFSGFVAYQLDGRMTYLHKAPYGESGLSAHLWAMEKGELDCFWHLYRTKKIILPVLGWIVVFSLAKYSFRLLRVLFKRITQIVDSCMLHRPTT